MSIYAKIYYNLCETRKSNKELYKPKSGLHKHHIKPEHSGGSNEEYNFTYLTVREHIIAHYLLWKIHKNPNDLRSMHMLGANLTPEYRRIIGKWCYENKIGYFSDKFSPEQKEEWRLKGLQTQKESFESTGDKNSFYYWSTEEGRCERASLGGKASIISENNPWSYWASEEGRKERASLGGKALKGTICVTNGKHRTRIKPELVNEYLSKGYTFGFTLN